MYEVDIIKPIKQLFLCEQNENYKCLGHSNISKELQKELDHIKKSLEDKIVEIGLKIDTLNFLQEILSAKEISNTDVIQLNKNIAVRLSDSAPVPRNEHRSRASGTSSCR